MTDVVDLAIVGGGPAGMAAAEVATGAGLTVAIVDEQQRLGGQILRQPPATFRVGNWLPGRAYGAVKAQLARAEALPARVLTGQSVHSVYRSDDGFDLMLAGPRGASMLRARRLLVATGCYDMPVAFPGWTLPGVTSAGAVQVFVKAQQIVPGERFVLAGTHPLQLILADQIVKAGGMVAAILFAQTPARGAALLRAPGVAMAHAGTLAAAAGAMARLARAGVPVRFGRIVVAADGGESVAAVRVAKLVDGRPGPVAETIACDSVATCFGFLPQSDLPRALGADAIPIAGTGGWRIRHDEWMRASVPGLYVAGEVTGVAGAEVSMLEGVIAGLGIASDSGSIESGDAVRRAGPTRRRLRSARRFAEMLAATADPTPFWPHLADDGTVICRCEDILRGTLADAIAGNPDAGPNAIKRLTRTGMGRCQGRGCEHHLRAMMPPSRPQGAFEPRMPVRPTPIGAVADAKTQG
ncbi:FAD-dependent oxidoreductase [Sphingomonas oryzagri]|uniref:FAD-dependent oxidoreductase n=1 Tax=Sphingomonas oryzagri TaxID=3042314 RepID=A0ABT6N3Z9_9SPHN|nr:FAD-dependent oxidoreductase [Sphingomonas oryzagri]MDH7640035.1 FAD-dependent oxidoreductase [Sphingomonas oryzagri]